MLDKKKIIVSVIIPVYNGEKFINRSLNSVLNLDNVGEIIIVDDGSNDNSLDICKSYEKKYSKVKVLTHFNNENKGVSASRNLGIKNSRFDYISFLDCDDIFLPNRFERAEELFSKDKSIDGIYEAIEINYSFDNQRKLYSISKELNHKNLFHYLLRGTYGHFSTDGIILKKSLFDNFGFFDEDLRLHEDSLLWLKFSYHGKLVAGNINKPVAIAYRHSSNSIYKASSQSNLIFRKKVKSYFKDKNIGLINWILINKRIATIKAKEENLNWLILFIQELLT